MIKAHSYILKARCPYFAAMLRNVGGFSETNGQGQSYSLIQIKNVAKPILNCVIQYLYSDSFMLLDLSMDFYLQLLIISDYFMLPRLVQICSSYIKELMTQQNALSVLLLAHAHNAHDLFRYCLNFVSKFEDCILMSKEWTLFKKYTDLHLYNEILGELVKFRDNFLV